MWDETGPGGSTPAAGPCGWRRTVGPGHPEPRREGPGWRRRASGPGSSQRRCCRRSGRRWRGRPGLRASPDRQLCQQILDRDQPGHMRADGLAELAARSKEPRVALRPPGFEHLGEVRIERTPGQCHLDDAADPGRVQGDLLVAGIAVGRLGEGPVHVIVPERAEPAELFGLRVQAPALSCATTASATWLVPTEVGSSRFSLRSYVTFSPRAITFAIAFSIASAAAASSRCLSIKTPDSITAIGLTLFL